MYGCVERGSVADAALGDGGTSERPANLGGSASESAVEEVDVAIVGERKITF